MSTIAEKKESKRLKILDSAYKLFITKSVNSTAVDDVVKLAGIAKGTFYLYFEDKYDLLNQIVAWKSSDLLLEALKQAELNSQPDITEKCVYIVDYIINTLIERPEFAALLDKRFSACFNLISSNKSDEFTETVNTLRALFTENGYDADEAGKTIYIIMDMAGSVCCDAILGKCPYSIEEIKPTIFGIIRQLTGKENN